MAQLKDTIVSGNLRVTDTTLTDTLQVTTIKAPTSSNETTYGPGTSGQVLTTNGTSTYWGAANNHTHSYIPTSAIDITNATNIGLDAAKNGFGYVNNVTKADWNYQQKDGALIRQVYSDLWKLELFGDYRTGHLSVRGKNTGTWQNWLRILDEGNYTTFTYSSTASRTKNTVLAAPDGSNGVATFRKLVAADLPSHTHNYAGSSSAGGPALSVSTAGGDVVLGTPSSSSNDSGDIYWKYGNGQEKARLYLSNTYTAKEGPLYRIFKSDGTGLYSGRLPLADGTSASGTWGISITGNAATSSNANAVNTTVTNGTTSSVSYGITFAADPNTSESNTMRKTNDFRISLKNGTAGTGGLAELVLGNNKNTSTADNKEGCISLYSSNTSYHTFKVASNTSAVTHTFPATTGTVLNSGTTSFTQTLSSGTKIGTIKINGTSTDLYCQTNTNTDTKVKVTTSTSKAYLIGTTTSPDGTAVEGVGNTGVYMTNGVLTAAFAGALSGNATTSSSWATARTLTLGGQLTGSVSVKGDANMTLNGYMDRAFIYDDQAVSDDHTWAEYAWHKFAEVTIATTYTDCVITFLVSRTHGSSAENTGILSAKLRTNGSKAYDSAQLKWLVRNSGLSKDDFVMVYTSTSGTSTKAELWCRLPGQYAGLIFTVLKEHLRHYSTNTSWTLVKTPDGSGSTHGSSSYPTTGITGTIVSSDGTITNSTTGTATSANALNLTHGNELNFSKLASTGHIWLGYRWNTQGTETSGGTTITTYKFGNANGAGGLAGLEASTSTFKSGNFGDQLIVERTTAGSMASVTFKNPSGILGYISANTVDGDLYHYGATDTSTMKYVILDSHNYSSYALASTTKYAGSSSAGGAANSANVLNKNTRMDYGWDGVNYFNINGTAGNAAKVNDTPTTAWWHIMRFNNYNSSGYYTDLAIPFGTTSLYYKRITAGSVQNGGWVKVLDSLNYTSYTYNATASRTANTVLAAPNGSDGTASFRALVAADLPDSYLPLSGGTMTGTIQGTYNNTHIALAGGGIGDYASLDHKNNINISSWNGVSISNGCSSVGTLDQVTFSVNARTGTTQQRGNAILYGYVRQYSTNAYYTDLKPNTLTASRTILLPNAAGTIAVFPAARTSGQVVVTDGTAGAVKSSGYTIAESVPSGAKFTDANLTQTAVGSTYTNYRPIVISNANSDTEGFSPSTTTGGSYITSSLYCQPSTGMLHANIFKAGKPKTTDGAVKGQMKFFSGNASDATGTVTLECVNDAARTGDYTVKLPTWNGTIPVFEKLFDGALSTVSLSYSDIDEYDLFLITVTNSNATSEQVTVASLWISNVVGVHDMPLIWGGTPSSSGGACNVTSGWIQLSKNSGTTTFSVAHKSNVAQMTSSGWSISSPTYNLYIRKIFGLKAYKRI